jgi:predicted RNA binding protein YcfA (HicA-like mRNA interferase family)
VSKLQPVSGEKVVEALRKAGFNPIRQKGSHVFLAHSDGRTTVVPIHKGEEVGRGLLQKIIHDTELTKEEFLELLKS